MIHHVILRLDSLLIEIDESCQSDESDVVVEIPRVELLVAEDVAGVELNVGVELGVVVHVPLAEANPEHRNRIISNDYLSLKLILVHTVFYSINCDFLCL